jgi:hypothetical protein
VTGAEGALCNDLRNVERSAIPGRAGGWVGETPWARDVSPRTASVPSFVFDAAILAFTVNRVAGRTG